MIHVASACGWNFFCPQESRDRVRPQTTCLEPPRFEPEPGTFDAEGHGGLALGGEGVQDAPKHPGRDHRGCEITVETEGRPHVPGRRDHPPIAEGEVAQRRDDVPIGREPCDLGHERLERLDAEHILPAFRALEE